MTIPATLKASIKAMSLDDLLGTPMPFTKAPKAPKVPRVSLTTEEMKVKRNAAQTLLRSTPEGKAYANAASKKSIALKKARVAAELEALKALVAGNIAAPTEEIVIADEADEEIIAVEEPPVVTKKASKKSKVIAEATDAPY